MFAGLGPSRAPYTYPLAGAISAPHSQCVKQLRLVTYPPVLSNTARNSFTALKSLLALRLSWS